MTQYIPKDTLVAEIESLKSAAETMLTGKTDLSYWKAQKHLCERILSFLDTLEVKEVDLSKYINKYFKEWYVDLTDQGNILHTPDGNAGLMSVKEVAKHFFELGKVVSNKEQKGE